MNNDSSATNAKSVPDQPIGVLFGGPSPEHDVSILTGLQTCRELSKENDQVVPLYWSQTNEMFAVNLRVEGRDFANGVPKGARAVQLDSGARQGFFASGLAGPKPLKIACVVVCCHGGPGETGAIQGALEVAQIPYTGPGVESAALTMDKLAFGAVMATSGLPSLPRVLLTNSSEQLPFAGPYIIKPRFGGSSIGVEVVDSISTAKELRRTSPYLRRGAVIEPFMPNSTDLNIAIRSSPELQLSALEKPLRSNAQASILNYTDKYIGGEGMTSAPRELPAVIEDSIASEVRRIATSVAELCDVRGVQRLDFLLDGDNVYVNEINPIPGSHSKYLWVNPKVSFRDLLIDMIAEAINEPTSAHWTTAGADGSVLRSAGSIAAKLS